MAKKSPSKPAKPTSGKADNKAMEKTMTQTTKQFDKFTQETNEFSRETYESFVKSGTIFARGFEDLMRTSLALAQDTAEKQSQYFKEAMGSKTLNEWTDVQNRIAQASFDDFMSGTTKLSELSVKLLNEASEPLNNQFSKGLKKATTAAAA